MSSPNSVKKKYVSSTNQTPPKLNAQPSRDALSPKAKELNSGSVVSTGSGKRTLPLKVDLVKFKKLLERPASVDDSFYDKFERLERECSDNVTRIKRGKDSSKQKKKESSKQKMSTSLLDRKRSKSGSLEGVSQNKSKPNSESFFEMAMKYDTNDLKATSSGHSRNNSNKKVETVFRSTSRSGRKTIHKDDGTRQRFLASSPSRKRGSSAKYRSVSRSERNRSKSRHRSRSSRHDRQESRNDRKRRSRSQSSKSSHKSGRSSATRRGRSRRRKNRSRSRRTSGRQYPSCSTPRSKNSSRRNSLKRSKQVSSVTSKDSSVSKRSNSGRGQSNGNDNHTGGKLSRTKDRALSGSSAVNSARGHEIKTKNLNSYDHNYKQNGQQEKDKASQGIQGKRTGSGVKGSKIINDLINNSSGKTMKMPSKGLPFSNTRKVL